MREALIISALFTGTAQAQIVIYTDQYGAPAGAALYQGNMQPPPQAQVQRQPQVVYVPQQPQYVPAPSVPSPYYINPQGANNEQRR